MVLYGYQRHAYQGTLIPIELSRSTTNLVIIGYSAAKQRELKLLLQSFLPSLPKATVRLPVSSTIEEIAFPVALALLAYEKHLLELQAPSVLCFGSLSLGGSIRPTPSLFNIAELCERHAIGLVLAGSNSLLPTTMNGHEFSECDTLADAISFLCRFSLKHQGEKAVGTTSPSGKELVHDPFAHIIGLKHEKQALIYAAVGTLPILLYGPPGTGKSLLLGRAISLLPPPNPSEKQEISALHGHPVDERPTFSIPVGMKEADLLEGTVPMLCKAHEGVLMVDELSHQRPSIRTTLTTLLDSHFWAGYPLRTWVVGATNACRCANLGSVTSICRCSELQIDAFWSRLGNPLLDRFAMALAMPSENLLLSEVCATTFDYARIEHAREVFRSRSEQEILGLLPLYTKVCHHTQQSFRRSLLCCKTAQAIADYEGKESVTQAIMEQSQQLYLLPKDRHYH